MKKILLDLGIGAINLLGVIVAIFVGTGLINKEIEKKNCPHPSTKTHQHRRIYHRQTYRFSGSLNYSCRHHDYIISRHHDNFWGRISSW